MASLPKEANGGDAAEPSPFGDDLRLSLACPQCGDIGWVEWKNLSRGIGCRNCGCTFLIGRDGLLHEHCGSPPIQYQCPRCRHSGFMPSAHVVRGMECVACQLPLVRGPNNALYGPDELAELLRTLKAAAAMSNARPSAPGSDDERGRPLTSLLYALGGGALAAAAIVLLTFFRSASPDAVAAKFTQACLAGDWSAAGDYLGDDAVQRTEFTRWKIRHFASIEARHRPKGDRVQVEVVLLEDDDRRRVYEVKMSSPFIGQRRHIQHWRQADGLWRFDAAATLARDGKHAAKRPPLQIAWSGSRATSKPRRRARSFDANRAS